MASQGTVAVRSPTPHHYGVADYSPPLVGRGFDAMGHHIVVAGEADGNLMYLKAGVWTPVASSLA